MRTILAQILNDNGFDYIYVAIPITDSFVTLLKKAKTIIEENTNFINGVTISGDIVTTNSPASEVFAPSLKVKDREIDPYSAIVVDYAIPKGKDIYLSLHIDSADQMSIVVIDQGDESYGVVHANTISLEEIFSK